MKIQKPNIPVSRQDVCDDFYQLVQQARQEDIDLTGLCIRGVCLDNEDLSGICFHGVILENCKFIGCCFERASFVDAVFQNCDFSGSDFSSCYFNRCEVNRCKWMGANLSAVMLRHVTMTQNNFVMVTFDYSKWNTVRATENDMSSANFYQCEFTQFQFGDTRLCGAVFFKTPLKGMNLTNAQIDGLVVSDRLEELKGAEVNLLQAVELAKLLGVIIRE